MAQYIFIKYRKESDTDDTLNRLKNVCQLLTPEQIKKYSEDTIEAWPNSQNSFYAIQNSKHVDRVTEDTLVMGFIAPEYGHSSNISSTSDGSYAVITNTANNITFYTDQFGSRTLWYYADSKSIIISTSQRAIVTLKQSFTLNKEAIAWFLSSGCQGPFISWDKDIQQVKPHLEYKFDANAWSLTYKQKQGMQLPEPGSTDWREFLTLYKNTVNKSLNDIIGQANKHDVLLPLSGGFDSRLLLGLISNSKLLTNVKLINWGVPQDLGLFDDKQAALRIAKYYNKDIIDTYLPKEVDDFDGILNNFIKACEGRIDHFNAFTDKFKLWENIIKAEYPFIIRGDIPYTEGVDVNNKQARAHLGLNRLLDYKNVINFDFDGYIALQRDFDIKIDSNESLISWRDRLYPQWRVPMVISAFSDQISAYTENRAPMMSWSLYKLYMGLPDKSKGNKAHIVKLWKKYEKSRVPTNATPSLLSMNSYFDNSKGRKYLINKLSRIENDSFISTQLIKDIRRHLINHSKRHKSSTNSMDVLKIKLKNWVSDKLPPLAKAKLKAKSPLNISEITFAYRVVMIDKIINMFNSDSHIDLDKK